MQRAFKWESFKIKLKLILIEFATLIVELCNFVAYEKNPITFRYA